MTGELPANVRELLHRVDTFEKLEVIIHLRSAPRAAMSIGELAAALELDRDAVRQAVLELEAGALVEVTGPGEVQLPPPASRDHDAVTELVRLYQEDRVAIGKTLGEIAMQRIRDMASRVFADALVQRKKPPRGDG